MTTAAPSIIPPSAKDIKTALDVIGWYQQFESAADITAAHGSTITGAIFGSVEDYLKEKRAEVMAGQFSVPYAQRIDPSNPHAPIAVRGKGSA